jgi:hypothetical protein
MTRGQPNLIIIYFYFGVGNYHVPTIFDDIESLGASNPNFETFRQSLKLFVF